MVITAILYVIYPEPAQLYRFLQARHAVKVYPVIVKINYELHETLYPANIPAKNSKLHAAQELQKRQKKVQWSDHILPASLVLYLEQDL